MAKLLPERLPVTILTGFLGSGKTTLLNTILAGSHGKKIAIIENEFGEVAIDDALLAKNSRFASDGEMIEVLNGCVCCSVRKDLIAIIKKLVRKCKSGELSLSAILIETTGMADPMVRVEAASPPEAGSPAQKPSRLTAAFDSRCVKPVAQSFFMDQEIRESTRLDGIITLVDAKHIEQHLDEAKPEGTVNEAAAQVSLLLGCLPLDAVLLPHAAVFICHPLPPTGWLCGSAPTQ